jgi:hypothetical protein
MRASTTGCYERQRRLHLAERPRLQAGNRHQILVAPAKRLRMRVERVDRPDLGRLGETRRRRAEPEGRR